MTATSTRTPPAHRILALDVGTSKVAGCVLDSERPRSVEACTVHRYGPDAVRPNAVDEGLVFRAIADTIAELGGGESQVSGVVLGLAAIQSSFVPVDAVIRVPRGQVTQGDIDALYEKARTRARTSDEVAVHIVPLQHLVDGRPAGAPSLGTRASLLGLRGRALRLPAQWVELSTAAVNAQRVPLLGIAATSFAMSRCVLGRSERRSGVVLVDIGASVVEVVVWQDDRLVEQFTLGTGMERVITELAGQLSASAVEVRRLVENHGSVYARHDGRKSLGFQRLCGTQAEVAGPRFRGELRAHVDELVQQIDEELEAAGVSRGTLPWRLTGGGAALPGLVEVAERVGWEATIAQLELDGGVVRSATVDGAISVGLYGCAHFGPAALYGARAARQDRGRIGAFLQTLRELF